jgi:hypothetical protein
VKDYLQILFENLNLVMDKSNLCIDCLGDDILKRRRYALINYQTYSFIIGGYDFDMKNKIRFKTGTLLLLEDQYMTMYRYQVPLFSIHKIQMKV